MTRISVAIKTWRGVVSDIINDNRFFTCSADAGMDFRFVVQAWVDTDKSALVDFLGEWLLLSF